MSIIFLSILSSFIQALDAELYTFLFDAELIENDNLNNKIKMSGFI